MPSHEWQVEPVMLSRKAMPPDKYDIYELEALNNHTLVSIMRQLGHLVHVSGHLFDGLSEELLNITLRTQRAIDRIHDLQLKVQSLDHRKVPIPEGDLDSFSRFKGHFKPSRPLDSHLFTLDTRPSSIDTMYQQASLTPVPLIQDMGRYSSDQVKRRGGTKYFVCKPIWIRPRPSPGFLDIELQKPKRLKDAPVMPPETVRERAKCPLSSLQVDTKVTSIETSGHDDESPRSTFRCDDPVMSRVYRMPSPTEQTAICSSQYPSSLIPIDVSMKGFRRMTSFRKSLIHPDFVIKRVRPERSRSKSADRLKRRNTISSGKDLIKDRRGRTMSQEDRLPRSTEDEGVQTDPQDIGSDRILRLTERLKELNKSSLLSSTHPPHHHLHNGDGHDVQYAIPIPRSKSDQSSGKITTNMTTSTSTSPPLPLRTSPTKYHHHHLDDGGRSSSGNWSASSSTTHSADSDHYHPSSHSPDGHGHHHHRKSQINSKDLVQFPDFLRSDTHSPLDLIKYPHNTASTPTTSCSTKTSPSSNGSTNHLVIKRHHPQSAMSTCSTSPSSTIQMGKKYANRDSESWLQYFDQDSSDASTVTPNAQDETSEVTSTSSDTETIKNSGDESVSMSMSKGRIRGDSVTSSCLDREDMKMKSIDDPDEDESVHSMDTDGYYTSMHLDSGLIKGKPNVQLVMTPNSSVRMKRGSVSSTVTVGNISLNSILSSIGSSISVTTKRSPPQVPVRTSSHTLRVTMASKEEDEDMVTDYPPSSESESEPHDLGLRRDKVMIDASKYPSLCVVTASEGSDSDGERQKTPRTSRSTMSKLKDLLHLKSLDSITKSISKSRESLDDKIKRAFSPFTRHRSTSKVSPDVTKNQVNAHVQPVIKRSSYHEGSRKEPHVKVLDEDPFTRLFPMRHHPVPWTVTSPLNRSDSPSSDSTVTPEPVTIVTSISTPKNIVKGDPGVDSLNREPQSRNHIFTPIVTGIVRKPQPSCPSLQSSCPPCPPQDEEEKIMNQLKSQSDEDSDSDSGMKFMQELMNFTPNSMDALAKVDVTARVNLFQTTDQVVRTSSSSLSPSSPVSCVRTRSLTPNSFSYDNRPNGSNGSRSRSSWSHEQNLNLSPRTSMDQFKRLLVMRQQKAASSPVAPRKSAAELLQIVPRKEVIPAISTMSNGVSGPILSPCPSDQMNGKTRVINGRIYKAPYKLEQMYPPIEETEEVNKSTELIAIHKKVTGSSEVISIRTDRSGSSTWV